MGNMTDLVTRLRKAIDETEAWARAASQTYEYADEGSKVPDGGVHWRWVIGENWDEVTPDPMTMQFLEGPDGSWSANLATVEEWPSTSRIDEERTRTTMMRRVYANAIEEMDPAAAGHIIRHDPAAALRRCAADRKILDWIVEVEQYSLDHTLWNAPEVEVPLAALAEAYGVEA
jgi:hypothetical protein